MVLVKISRATKSLCSAYVKALQLDFATSKTDLWDMAKSCCLNVDMCNKIALEATKSN